MKALMGTYGLKHWCWQEVALPNRSIEAITNQYIVGISGGYVCLKGYVDASI